MNRNIEEIAKRRGISYRQAEWFCIEVYRHFEIVAPGVIAQAVKKWPDASPREIAAQFRPASPRHSRGPGHAAGNITVRKRKRADYGSELETKPFTTNTRFEENPLRSKNRLDPNQAETCPHGVPFYRPCRICKPDEWD